MTKVIKAYDRKRNVKKTAIIPFCQFLSGPFSHHCVFRFVASQDMIIENLNILSMSPIADMKLSVLVGRNDSLVYTADILALHGYGGDPVEIKEGFCVSLISDNPQDLTSLTISFNMKIKI